MTLRLGAASVLITAVLACSSCSYGTRIYNDAVEEAEKGVASAVEYRSSQAGTLLASTESIDQITTENLKAAFGTVLTDYSGDGPLTINRNSAVYGVENDGDTVEFSLFVTSSVQRSGPGLTVIVMRFGCGTLTGAFGSSSVTLADTPCPPPFSDWGDENDKELSLTEISTEYGGSGAPS